MTKQKLSNKDLASKKIMCGLNGFTKCYSGYTLILSRLLPAVESDVLATISFFTDRGWPFEHYVVGLDIQDGRGDYGRISLTVTPAQLNKIFGHLGININAECEEFKQQHMA